MVPIAPRKAIDTNKSTAALQIMFYINTMV